ncbi:hypothetical protein [Arenibacterium sp. LLYu02]|uniref:hypothetical protein n=1 Tax=Arenibacterium sp. LLYu02 TaxID=3404132 RepID=UPI003B216636
MTSRNRATMHAPWKIRQKLGPAPILLRVGKCDEDKLLDGAAPNVVTEDSLRDLLSDGFLIEAICNQTAEKRHNSWYGS